MPKIVDKPSIIKAAGTKPKLIEEYFGRVASKSEAVSIAQMRSPKGWVEPGQRPDFDEYTVVLEGTLRVEYEGGQIDVEAGQGILTQKGEWIRYSTPLEDTRYIAVCLPAFSIDTVHRDAP